MKHDYDTEATALGFRARCICGWISRYYRRIGQAQVEGEAHKRHGR